MKMTGITSLLLALILMAYLGMGLLYAIYTPAWQVPDEPAHYNYVRHLAEMGHLPILRMGDYPHEYLEEIKARRFPPELSIDPIRYEFHQPPLYYLLAVPVYWLGGGRPLPLRLFSVALGAALLLIAYGLVRRIFPGRPTLALGTVAFVAFVPMHVAMTAGVENDTLAEVLLATVALLAVQHIMDGAEGNSGETRNRLALMGVMLGLVLVTKTTAYVAIPVALAAIIWRWHLTHHASRFRSCRLLGWQLLLAFAPALLIALPWYVRNAVVYGWPDIIGLRWHNAVVVGQPRTAEWIAHYGWGTFLRRFAEFTFKSFWGVFGWLGVFVDNRIYLALGLMSGVVAVGLGSLVARRSWARAEWGLRGSGGNSRGLEGALGQLMLLALWIGFTVLQYLGYNITFVQHQGRYLFPALIPFGLAFALGWQEVLRPRMSRKVAALLAVVVLILAAIGLARGDWPTWPLILTLAVALGLLVRPQLPRRLDGLLFALPFIGLALLDLICLFGFIVPALRG